MRVALVDGGSFVLPYDTQLAAALAAQGVGVDFKGSRTRYNGELLDAMRVLPGATVTALDVSGSVAPRWRGALAYLKLLFGLWRERKRFDAINLQFSVAWPLELPILWLLREKLVFTVHNPVPHGFAGTTHAPTASIAGLARTLVFASRFAHDDFIARYGERFRAKSRVVGHGLLPVVQGSPPVPYRAAKPTALVYWSTVRPHKGVELFAELARSPRWRTLGLGLEVHGAWASGMDDLKAELQALGVRVEDRYLDAAELQALLARDVVFALPYREASQSGALFTLLHAGRPFLCSDVGDLGDLMRRFGLEPMLLTERSAEGLLDALERLLADPDGAARAYQTAQDRSAWSETARDLVAVYAGR